MKLHRQARSLRYGVLLVAAAFLAVSSFVYADDEGTPANGTSSATKPKTDWAERLREATVKEGQPILLVVHSAKDCVYCARWKGALGGKGDFESWAKDHPDVHLIIVEREAIASAEHAEDYPQTLQWLYERNEERAHLQPGTPMFEVFVVRKMVWRSYGYQSWARDVFPALKDLDQRRTSAVSAVGLKDGRHQTPD
jgi:thioredoxin-related protein